MRAINAIPAVIAAAPGLLSPLDLPLIPGRGTIRGAADVTSLILHAFASAPTLRKHRGRS